MKYHRGKDEAPVQEAPVLARFWSFLFRFYGENWVGMVLSESGEVLLFELRAIFAGWLGLTMEQREEFALAMGSWPQTVFRARVRSLVEAGDSFAWIKQLLLARLSSPIGLVLITSLPILCVGSFHLFWDCTFQNLSEEYIVKPKNLLNCHLLPRVEQLKLLEKNKVIIVQSE